MEVIEIPFGAKDSELQEWTYTIPKGMKAEIRDGKVVIKKKESEDERIRKAIIESLPKYGYLPQTSIKVEDAIAWLEKQKYDRMKPIYDARESFESALEKAWNDYHNGYKNVDKLEDDYVECAHAKGFREGYLFGIEKQKGQKPVEPIEFSNEFENQVSHLLASVLNGEHEYNEGFVKYVAQSLLGYAKKEQKPVEFDEYKIIKKHITEDMLSSEVNKRLTECGWYVTAKIHYADTSELEKCTEWLKGLQPTEGIKGNLEEIPSNVDLEEAAKEYIEHHKLETASITKLSMYRSLAFKEGAKWMAEQIKGGSK